MEKPSNQQQRARRDRRVADLPKDELRRLFGITEDRRNWMTCVLAATAMEQQCENDQRELRALKDELVSALEELLYGGFEMEQAMTPAGDALTAIYPKGTLPRLRELLGRAKLEGMDHFRQSTEQRNTTVE